MSELQIATFATGCFWCTEAIFAGLRGVSKVTSGYAGGDVDAPTYEQVSTGDTGHAECSQIEFDPSVISFSDLLEVFWECHDPTSLNKQGADVGTQYRSAIFCHNQSQFDQATKARAEVDNSGRFPQPIVTEITMLDKFYPAEDYHQDFYAENPNYGYCQVVINPKLTKLREKFAKLMS